MGDNNCRNIVLSRSGAALEKIVCVFVAERKSKGKLSYLKDSRGLAGLYFLLISCIKSVVETNSVFSELGNIRSFRVTLGLLCQQEFGIKQIEMRVQTKGKSSLKHTMLCHF